MYNTSYPTNTTLLENATRWTEYVLHTGEHIWRATGLSVVVVSGITVVMPCCIVYEVIGYWPFGFYVCQLWQVCDVMLCTSSIMHMCTISIDRYLGIRDPLVARNRSSTVVGVKIALVWIISMVIACPVIFLGFFRPEQVMLDYQCVINNRHFLIYGSLSAFFVPLVIMLVAYSLSIRLLRSQAVRLSAAGGGGHTDGMRRTQTSRSRKPVTLPASTTRTLDDRSIVVSASEVENSVWKPSCYRDITIAKNVCGSASSRLVRQRATCEISIGHRLARYRDGCSSSRASQPLPNGDPTNIGLEPLSARRLRSFSRRYDHYFPIRSSESSLSSVAHRELATRSTNTDIVPMSSYAGTMNPDGGPKSNHCFQEDGLVDEHRLLSVRNCMGCCLTKYSRYGNSRVYGELESRSCRSKCRYLCSDTKSNSPNSLTEYRTLQELTNENCENLVTDIGKQTLPLRNDFEQKFSITNTISKDLVSTPVADVDQSNDNTSKQPTNGSHISSAASQTNSETKGDSETKGQVRFRSLVQKHSATIRVAGILLAKRDDQKQKAAMNTVRTERKAIRVLGTMFVIFVACWAPFFAVNLVSGVCDSCDVDPFLFSAFLWLGYISSTLNPIVYTIFNKTFRRVFLRLLLCRYRSQRVVALSNKYSDSNIPT